MVKVFLGGTCCETTWRQDLISVLKVDYYNPVVENWTESCIAEEICQRALCDYCLYVVTPDMVGFYSIAEMVDDSNKRPEKCLVCFLPEGKYGIEFNLPQKKSIEAIKSLIIKNGGKVFNNLLSISLFLNSLESPLVKDNGNEK